MENKKFLVFKILALKIFHVIKKKPNSSMKFLFIL